MSFFSKIASMFRTKTVLQKKTLASVEADEVRRERIRIEQTELRITEDIEELESRKADLFRKGVESGSDRQRLQIARKVRELDGEVQAKDRQLALISKNLRVLNGIAQLKENQRLLRDLGMEGLISQMDLEELQEFVEQATVEGQFQMERFTTLLDSVEESENVFRPTGEDDDTLAIFEAMQQAAESGTDEAVSDGLRQADASLLQRMVAPTE